MVLIKDVAYLADVSIMTVSRVINETGYVSEKTRERVQGVIGETGYKVNQTAVGLRTGKTSSVGVIISDISNPFFPTILKGIDQVCSQNKYDTILFNTGEDSEKELRYIDLLKQKSVKGIIISSCIADYKENKDVFADLTPVFFNRQPIGIAADVVLNDNRNEMFTATEHFIKTGHRKIALINGNLTMSTFRERQQGYLDALQKYKVPVDKALIISGDYSIEGGYRSMEKIYITGIRPEAILPANNFMTQGVYNYLKEHRISVPEDVSLIGHGDFDWCSLVDPPLTVLAHKKFEMGARAAEILFDRLKTGSVNSYQSIILEPRFIIRHSVKNKSKRGLNTLTTNGGCMLETRTVMRQ